MAQPSGSVFADLQRAEEPAQEQIGPLRSARRPHRKRLRLDYELAARVFGGLHVEQCVQQFSFGREGKPFYCRDPKATEQPTRRIVLQLEKRCGPGNYNYLAGLGNPEDLGRVFN